MKDATDNQIRQVMSTLGKRGGAARAKALTKAERRQIAQAAAKKRWEGSTHPGTGANVPGDAIGHEALGGRSVSERLSELRKEIARRRKENNS